MISARSIITSILLCTFLFQINAKNYYVAKSGSDSNAGTQDAPYLTITKVQSKALAGDSVYIMKGIYRETMGLIRAGNSSSPIVYKSFGNDTVIVSALNIISNWEIHSENIYKTSAKMTMNELNMLYYNGKAMDIARWPNNSDDDRFTIDAEPIQGGSGSHIECNNIPSFNWTGGYVWYLGAHSGASWTRPITASTNGRIDFEGVDINKWPFNPHNPTVFRNNNRGRIFLFGKLEALDHPGEWYYDKSKEELYFYAPNGEDPNDALTEIAARSSSIFISGNFIHVDGINAIGGTIQVNGDRCIVRNGEFNHCLETLDELNNSDAQMNNGAITVKGRYVTVENNVINWSSSSGISGIGSGISDLTIRNNIIQNVNTIGIHSCGIRTRASRAVIVNNTIRNCGRDGIYLSGSNGEIAYNDLYQCMKINNDGGVFYTVGNSSLKNTKIHHNWLHDSFGPDYADGRAAGIYLDNNSKGYEVHHNVVWNVTWSGLQINWYNTHIDFFNNSFWNVGAAMGRWDNDYDEHDNRVWNNYSPKGVWENADFKPSLKTNIINSNSPYTSVSNHNFAPKEGSILIDKATVIEGITDGYLDDKPDIGAYEYGGIQWIPGASLGLDSLALIPPQKAYFTGKNLEFILQYFTKSSRKINLILSNPQGYLFGDTVVNIHGGQGIKKIILNTNPVLNEGQYTLDILLLEEQTTKELFSIRETIELANPVFAEQILIESESKRIELFQSVPLKAFVLPDNTHDKTVLWSSSHPEIIQVNALGEISAMRLGEAVITATTSNGLSDSILFEVIPKAGEAIPWIEEFTFPNDTKLDTGTTSWTVIKSNPLSGALASVNQNKFVIRSTECLFNTGEIDIFSVSSVNLEIDVTADFRARDVAKDSLHIYYILDSIEYLAGTFTDRQKKTTLQVKNISGEKISIRIEGKTGYSDEIYFIDNIRITAAIDLGIDDSITQSHIQIYPNPLRGNQLYIKGVPLNAQIKLLDLNGRLVFQSKTVANSLLLPALNDGIYLIELMINQQRIMKRLIVL